MNKGIVHLFVVVFAAVVAIGIVYMSFGSSPNTKGQIRNAFANIFTKDKSSDQVLSRGFLKVQGNNIVNAKGKLVYLRGFQGYDFYPIPEELYYKAIFEKGADPYKFDEYAVDLNNYTISDFDFQEMKSNGANVVRLWFNPLEIEKAPYQHSQTALNLLADTVNRFGEKGIYVILVMGDAGQNEYVGQQIPGNYSLWDKGNGIWDRTVALWGVVADKLKDNTYIAGYDLINEPQSPTKEMLHSYYTDVINSIRAKDQNHILFLAVAEKNEDTFQIGGNYNDNNIAATFHFYYPQVFTNPQGDPKNADLYYPGQIGDKYWDKNALDAILKSAVNLSELKDKPILVGEFGANGNADANGALTWISDMLSLLNTYNLHYTFHNYRSRSYQGDWTMKPEVKQEMMNVITALLNGTLKYEDITEEQKQLLMTENGYDQRAGIEKILTTGFRSKK